jgi:transcriptional repressor NrdR
MIDELEERALHEGMDSHEITASRLGELVLDRLYELDRVAYIRFASVYRNFENVEEFIREIDALAREGGPAGMRRDTDSGEGT